MDWFDRRIVEYVLMWAPYGRLPDEDVFPRFGMTGHQFGVRFTAIVSTLTSTDGDLDDLDRALIARARAVAPPPTERDPRARKRGSAALGGPIGAYLKLCPRSKNCIPTSTRKHNPRGQSQ